MLHISRPAAYRVVEADRERSILHGTEDLRDTMPQAGTVCTVKAELPLETEILVSDYLPPVFKLVKCFAKPVILQKQLQPGRLTLEGYLRCTVYYQARRVQASARPNRNCPLQSSWNCRN